MQTAETPEIHEAARAFAGAVSEYERGRAGYPPDAIAWLCERLAIGAGADVLDLAAGTGNLTRVLLATGANVLAVEPIAEMRAALTEVETVEGTAEAIPFPDGSFDAVTVGQAFHWFDFERAIAEIHRVLRPAGGIGLIWNRGDTRTGWVEEVDAVVRSVRPPGVPTFKDGAWRRAFDETTRFAPIEEHEFPHEVTATAESVRDRVASISFIAALSPWNRGPVLARIDEITAALPERFPYPYRTHVYVCATAL